MTRLTLPWSELCSVFEEAKITSETYQEYIAASKDEQTRIKDVGGFVGGVFADNQRHDVSLAARDVVTLDFDSATPDTIEDIKLSGYDCVVYSTHTHTPEAPRLRVIVPLTRPVKKHEYEPIARAIAYNIDIESADRTTYQASRLMFSPSVSKDAEYLYFTVDGDWADPDHILEVYYNTWQNPHEWYRAKNEEVILPKGEPTTVQDPLTKGGYIGAFCQAYPIYEAIDTFLPQVYTNKRGNRYTYAQGSTSHGLIIYDGKFAYSNHNTDPAHGYRQNAYDLVRIHLYGHLDNDSKVHSFDRLPSVQAMNSHVAKDPRVLKAGVGTAFKDNPYIVEVDNKAEQIASIIAKLKKNEKGCILNYTPNLEAILQNDPVLNFAAVRFDLFSYRTVVTGKLPWHRDPYSTWWDDADDAQLRSYIERVYGVRSEKPLHDAKEVVLSTQMGHAVQEHIQSTSWDGYERVETLFIDYLGVEDTPLNRAMSRKALVACVARVFDPGCKFDCMLTFKGVEGIGKSTILKRLGGDWFSDSFYSIEGKEAMEQLRGKWIIEFAELNTTKKAEKTATKHFLSKQSDSFRGAYARHEKSYKRQCVFFGTTNEDEFLTGSTGDRRMWVVTCNKAAQKKLPWELDTDTVAQVWAEALVLYKQGENLFLDKDESMELVDVQIGYRRRDPIEHIVENYLLTPVPCYWYDMTKSERLESLNKSRHTPLDSYDDTPPEGTILRPRICPAEVISECFQREATFEKSIPTSLRINDIIKNLPGWGDETKLCRDKAYKVQRFLHRKGATMPDPDGPTSFRIEIDNDLPF